MDSFWDSRHFWQVNDEVSVDPRDGTAPVTRPDCNVPHRSHFRWYVILPSPWLRITAPLSAVAVTGAEVRA